MVTNLTDSELDALQQAAEKAPSGQNWWTEDELVSFSQLAVNDRPFVALANPSTILSLIAQLREARVYEPSPTFIEKIKSDKYDLLAGKYRELEAELAEARATIERVRAIHKRSMYGVHEDFDHYFCAICSDDPNGPGTVFYPCPTVKALDGPSTEETE